MNRRNFLAAVGAVLAFPVAVAKALVAKKPKQGLVYDNASCELCRSKPTRLYVVPDEKTTPELPFSRPGPAVYLCDECGDKFKAQTEWMVLK